MLPAEFVDELAGLQDQAAPVPWPAIEQVIITELVARSQTCSPTSIVSR